MLKEKYNGIAVRVTKLKDNKFNGKHPNHINEGYKTEGFIHKGDIGSILFIDGLGRWLRTSLIKSIEENEGYDLVHTENSTYKIEKAYE